MDIEQSENEYTKKRNEELLRKNNEELDRICKKCCLCLGWLLVIMLFIYAFTMIINHFDTY